MNLKERIRAIPDFPKAGIMFRDISPLLADPLALRETVRQLAETLRPYHLQRIVAIESRGFLFGAPLALELNCGLALVRKRGKLPGETITYNYLLEYGSDTLEIQSDALASGERVAIVDDLLATGGTCAAAAALCRKAGGEVVAASFVIELTALKGRENLGDLPSHALISYD
ncbi:MAG: adenine phosphoribosyltransferase [Alphaproteobacteria bacterium]|nr:MAG: adenine phosphoribosyltransferase [Alphaproteobacteria bacterium]